MLARQPFAIPLATIAFALSALAVNAQSPEAAAPVPNVKPEGMVLLEDTATLNKRVKDFKDLARYLDAVRGAFAEAYEKIKTPETISVVVAVKPGRKSRLWVMSSLQPPPDSAGIMARFQAIPAPEVQEGPVAFAIKFTVAGAKAEKVPLLPPEWKDAFAGKEAILPDAITMYIWKD